MTNLVKSSSRFLKALPDVEQLAIDLGGKYGVFDTVHFLCYDITLLRKINHAYGRKVGDSLLTAIADWVTGFPGGRLYRVEGDLFCLLFVDTALDDVRQYASMLDLRFGNVWHLEFADFSMDAYVQASIAVLGDVEYHNNLELSDLFERALEVSRKTKQVTLFDEEHDRMTREHVRLQMELKSCILSGMAGFEINFQPIADPVSATWRGLEALCRWRGPTIGPVPPNIFIPEAEEMGLIHTLGNWMLDNALATCKRLGLDRLDRFFVSVNVSAIQISKKDFVPTVLYTLERRGFPPGKLLLEITESTQFTFNEITATAIETLRGKGIQFALDDFGTGYSGFSNLKNLPVDMLKTEREFIENIENDNYLQYFYYIMSETAHANGMQLIAEGIENADQLRNVVKNGADLLQGYLFGKPMSTAALDEQKYKFTQPMDEFYGCMQTLSDLKQWINGQDAYNITPALFRLQNQCIRAILNEASLDDAVNRTMEVVGTHFKVSRVYLFLRDEGTLFSNRYEWCAEGILSQKHLFQNVDGDADGFYDILRENEVVIASNPEQLPANLQLRLEEGGQAGAVQSMAVMPMKQRGDIIGFVGFDSEVDREWMPEELIILYNLCMLCLIILAKNEH